MLSRHRFCCYMCLPNALLLIESGLHILPNILIITLVYVNYFYLKNCIGFHIAVDILLDFESMYPGFESRASHEFLSIYYFFVIIITVQICKFNITVSTQILLLYYPL